MTKEKLLEGNKLIAEFMEGIFKIVDLDTKNSEECVFFNKGNDPFPFNSLAYHRDWNWLMEVVEKIDILSTKDSSKLKIEELSIFSEIYEVWIAAIEFIEWYNKSKQ